MMNGYFKFFDYVNVDKFGAKEMCRIIQICRTSYNDGELSNAIESHGFKNKDMKKDWESVDNVTKFVKYIRRHDWWYSPRVVYRNRRCGDGKYYPCIVMPIE